MSRLLDLCNEDPIGQVIAMKIVGSLLCALCNSKCLPLLPATGKAYNLSEPNGIWNKVQIDSARE